MPFLYSFSARCTGYYPTPDATSSPENRLEGGPTDRHGKPLCTLEQCATGHAEYVSVAMDISAFPYGTKLCIPAFNERYGRQIEFRVVDTGSAFTGKGTARMDICCNDKSKSEAAFLNDIHTVVALKV